MSDNTQTLDDSTYASDPGNLSLAKEKLKLLRPDLYGIRGLPETFKEWFNVGWPQRTYIKEQLENGDSRAAVVVSTTPLIIAAYTDELDCVAMLKLGPDFVKHYNLEIGSRLLTVNCYGEGGDYPPDFILGPQLIERWTRFHPLIAEFLSNDIYKIETRKAQIREEEWERAEQMGFEYLKVKPGVTRDGRPIFSAEPGRG